MAWRALAQLSRLDSLKLSSNALSGGLWGATVPPSLVSFDISDNMISGGLPAALPPRLVSFDASTNGIQGTIPYNIALPPTLEYLDLTKWVASSPWAVLAAAVRQNCQG